MVWPQLTLYCINVLVPSMYVATLSLVPLSKQLTHTRAFLFRTLTPQPHANTTHLPGEALPPLPVPYPEDLRAGGGRRMVWLLLPSIRCQDAYEPARWGHDAANSIQLWWSVYQLCCMFLHMLFNFSISSLLFFGMGWCYHLQNSQALALGDWY